MNSWYQFWVLSMYCMKNSPAWQYSVWAISHYLLLVKIVLICPILIGEWGLYLWYCGVQWVFATDVKTAGAIIFPWTANRGLQTIWWGSVSVLSYINLLSFLKSGYIMIRLILLSTTLLEVFFINLKSEWKYFVATKPNLNRMMMECWPCLNFHWHWHSLVILFQNVNWNKC